MPSPFLFAILLTYFVYGLALALGELGMIEQPDGGTAGPFALVELWFDGFWNFLAFAMQMTLILMTGFALAYHPRANDLLVRLAKLPNSGGQAVVLVAVFSMAVAWIHWALASFWVRSSPARWGKSPTNRVSTSITRFSRSPGTWGSASRGTGGCRGRRRCF